MYASLGSNISKQQRSTEEKPEMSDPLEFIPSGNVRRLVEKFRRLGEQQEVLSKPYSRARKVPGSSLGSGFSHRSVSLRKKGSLSTRRKSERLRKNKGIDETSASCLFCPQEFLSCSDGISKNPVDHRLFRCFAPKEDSESLAIIGQIPSLDNCEQNLSRSHGQIGCITDDTSEKSTNDSGNYSLSEMTAMVAIPEDIYFDATTECLKDETLLDQKSEATGRPRHDLDADVENNFVINENIEPDLQPVSVSQSDAFILTLSTSSNGSESTDNTNFDNTIENLSISQRNSNVGKEIELEKGNDVADDLYKSTSRNSVCKEVEIDPKSLDYLDEARSLATTEVSGGDITRIRHSSENSATSSSSDSFDLDLAECDTIHRNKCLSLTLPTRMNSITSNHEQESSYSNARRAVKSFPLDSSWRKTTFVNASNDVLVNPSEMISHHQNKTQKSTKQCHKACEKNGVENDELRNCEECDFDSRRPDAEISSFQRDEQTQNDTEPILRQLSSADVSCVHVTLRDHASSEDDSKKLSLSDDVSLRDSDASSVSDSVLDCGEFRDCKSNDADAKQIPIFEPVNKLERIKVELVETERKYIDRLWLINNEFRVALMSWNREAEFLPADVFHHMFLNVDVIYQLHSQFFLPALEDCIKSDGNNRIEDVFLKNADFLKLYVEYSSKFDNAMKTIETWKARVPEFSRMIKEIQSKPVCQSLTLQHHMLEPVQRIPRYQLLLSDYLKNLPKDSPEYEKAEKALIKVTTAANHCNNFLKSLDKFRKVLDVQQSLRNKIELLAPSRELILSGKMKVTRQLRKEEDRQLFLFSDMLLICKKFPPGITPPYKLTLKLDIKDMKVYDRRKEGSAESFFLSTRQGYLEIHPSSLEEREKWISALQTVISNSGSPEQLSEELKSIPGSWAPIWIKDPCANHCMCCEERFNAIRRRHHCRACGIVVCGKCSNRQVPLEFDNFSQSHRVCDKCFRKIQDFVDESRTEQRGIDASEDVSSLTTDDEKSSSINTQCQMTIPTTGEKSQNYEETDDELTFAL